MKILTSKKSILVFAQLNPFKIAESWIRENTFKNQWDFNNLQNNLEIQTMLCAPQDVTNNCK